MSIGYRYVRMQTDDARQHPTMGLILARDRPVREPIAGRQGRHRAHLVPLFSIPPHYHKMFLLQQQLVDDRRRYAELPEKAPRRVAIKPRRRSLW